MQNGIWRRRGGGSPRRFGVVGLIVAVLVSPTLALADPVSSQVSEPPTEPMATLTGAITNAFDVPGPAGPGVKAVLYRDNGSGGRGRWLGPAVTDADGVYTFDVEPGCYVVDLVAPIGRVWFATRTEFKQLRVCAGVGETKAGLDGRLRGNLASGELRGTVTSDSGPEPDVRIVVYRQNYDGTRGRWIGRNFTRANGTFSFPGGSGCFVVDLVAPGGYIWAATSGRYKQYRPCFATDAGAHGLDGKLLPSGRP